MGGASRFIMLVTTPFPSILYSRPSLFRLTRPSLLSLSTTPHHLTLSPSSPPHQLLLPIKSSQQQQIHAQSNTLKEDHFQDSPPGFSPTSGASHPWPDWSKLIDTVSTSGYFDRQRLDAAEGHEIIPEDAFVAYEELNDEFVHAANACLAFARERSNLLGLLSRRDIQVVVENGTPFLFKSALDTARRMRSFLGIGGSSGSSVRKCDVVGGGDM
ncbi:unnamed protein product [Ilex paraguariensis]|uniref:Uncharacterized protein n=1 Tax=Ilex paraguariensis TaxID=185542 RepID=A0ABC8RNW4_9AQUA